MPRFGLHLQTITNNEEKGNSRSQLAFGVDCGARGNNVTQRNSTYNCASFMPKEGP